MKLWVAAGLGICFLFSPFALAENVVVNEQDSVETMDVAEGSGYATNDSNAEIYVTFVSRAGGEETQVAMPGQTLTVPEDTIEVRAELVDDSFRDIQVTLDIVMPDGSEHTLRAFPGSVRIVKKSS